MGSMAGTIVGRFLPLLGFFHRMESASKTVELRFDLPTCRECSASIGSING